jgi:hypothetical protein
MIGIGKEFELKNLGPVKQYLGVDVERNENGADLLTKPLGPQRLKALIRIAGVTE